MHYLTINKHTLYCFLFSLLLFFYFIFNITAWSKNIFDCASAMISLVDIMYTGKEQYVLWSLYEGFLIFSNMILLYKNIKNVLLKEVKAQKMKRKRPLCLLSALSWHTTIIVNNFYSLTIMNKVRSICENYEFWPTVGLDSTLMSKINKKWKFILLINLLFG